jgi:predicted secreted protein with PEFG-CTERM motif
MHQLKKFVLVIALMVVVLVIYCPLVGQYQIKAFGEIASLTPPETTIKVNDTDFTIPYTITGGNITLIQADTDAKTIDVSVQSPSGGNLTITLPTKFINAYESPSLEPEYLQGTSNEAHFVVMSKNHDIHYTEVDTSENRTMIIPFGLGATTVEIKGTYMVPEFGSLTSVILIVAVISVIITSRNHSKL